MDLATEPLKVVIYARASQARGPEAKSVADQLRVLRAWAEREGWTVVAELEDGNISASRYAKGKAREDWEKVIATVERGAARAILTWTFSRNTRDRRVYAELAELCEDTGTLLGYGGRLYDMRNEDDAFATDMQMALAVRDPKVISKNVRNAAEGRAARGKPHGDLGDPWFRVFDPETGKVIGHEVDEARAAIYVEAIDRILERRESVRSVALDLNRRGLFTASGKIWHPGNLTKGMLRPSLAGLRVHHGEVLDGVGGTWPKVIEPETHYRLVTLFADPERDKHRQTTATRHLGTGIFRCGRDGCDGRVRTFSHHGRPTYGCQQCHKITRRQAEVDQFVEAVMVARLSKPDALEALSGQETAEDRQEARTRVAKLKAEHAQAQTELKARRMSLADFTAWKAGWQQDMTEAEKDATPANVPASVRGLVGPDAADRWAAAPVTSRRETVDLFVTVTILPVGGRRNVPIDQQIGISWK